MKQLILLTSLLKFGIADAQNDTSVYGYTDSTLIITEITPVFVGGPAMWEKYLNKNIRYPEEAIEKKIQGTVIVEFIIDKNGHPSNIRIFRTVDPILNNEAIRLIKKSLWVPAIQNGRPVIYRMRQNIVFNL